MPIDIAHELVLLKSMTVPELKIRYAEVFREQTKTTNKPWLIKRIAWRLQALSEGDLSERARQRALALANDADLRRNPPKHPKPVTRTVVTELPTTRDRRLPPVGSTITRIYKGKRLEVGVHVHGFEYLGQVYKSLSAVAKAISGTHCNGYHFFGLQRKGSKV
jgi:hypothetical protein